MKVLLISHNAISTYDNMGKTLLSLFSEFSRDEICQLYIHPAAPDVEGCCSYYRITDSEAVASVFLPFRSIGSVVTGIEETHKAYLPGKIRSGLNATKEELLLLIRDFFWKHSHWYNSRMREWLSDQKPDCVFIAPGNSRFIYDIALRISGELNVPIITYICDDFYFSAVRRLHSRLLRKSIERLLAHSSSLITISDNMRKDYSRVFDVPAVTIMTGSSISRAESVKTGKVKNISYFGNLSLGRYVNLGKMGEVLDEINAGSNDLVLLHVYSGDSDRKIDDTLGKSKAVRIEGFVSGKEYETAFSDADVLVHVESFDTENEQRVRYSVSTKIADSLASGRLLFAFGPSGVASMDYLKESSSAWTVTDPTMLGSAIREMLADPGRREDIEKKGLETAKINHDPVINSLKVRTVIEQSIKNASVAE